MDGEPQHHIRKRYGVDGYEPTEVCNASVGRSRAFSHASRAKGTITRRDTRTQLARISAVSHRFPAASVTTGGAMEGQRSRNRSPRRASAPGCRLGGRIADLEVVLSH